MRLLAQGERASKKEQAEKKAREDDEPVCQLVPMSTAVKLREICSALARELPQGATEMRMSRLRAPKTSVGAALRDGASVDQAATHAALKALEQWVPILRPFASPENLQTNLAMLVARIVHIQEGETWKRTSKKMSLDQAQTFVQELSGSQRDFSPGASSPGPPQERMPYVVAPAEWEPLGAALRRIVPKPELLQISRWEWMEDLLSALEYEESFDRSSFVHRSSTPSGTFSQTGAHLVSEVARPRTTGMLANRPSSRSAMLRLSGDFPWASFNPTFGFRSCTTSFNTDKYHRSIPGPAVYCDYDKKMSLPQHAGRGVYPSVGDRRTPCTATPLLSQLDRFFQTDYRVE